jgi:hypothetical protein
MRAARRHGLQPHLLDARNSADTAGSDRDRVVGYGALAFLPPAATGCGTATPAGASGLPPDAAPHPAPESVPDAALGRALLATARGAIADALGLPVPAVAAHPALLQPGASFVTLHDAQGGLRGCIGHLEATRSLGDDVRANARAAAFDDTRFDPVGAAEWPGLRLEVSLLGPLQPLAAAASAAAAAAQLQPGVDGVVLAWQGRHATFLPQVWAQLPGPQAFLRALLAKAGLAPDFWHPGIQLWRYRVSAFEETGDEASDAAHRIH